MEKFKNDGNQAHKSYMISVRNAKFALAITGVLALGCDKTQGQSTSSPITQTTKVLKTATPQTNLEYKYPTIDQLKQILIKKGWSIIKEGLGKQEGRTIIILADYHYESQSANKGNLLGTVQNKQFELMGEIAENFNHLCIVQENQIDLMANDPELSLSATGLDTENEFSQAVYAIAQEPLIKNREHLARKYIKSQKPFDSDILATAVYGGKLRHFSTLTIEACMQQKSITDLFLVYRKRLNECIVSERTGLCLHETKDKYLKGSKDKSIMEEYFLVKYIYEKLVKDMSHERHVVAANREASDAINVQEKIVFVRAGAGHAPQLVNSIKHAGINYIVIVPKEKEQETRGILTYKGEYYISPTFAKDFPDCQNGTYGEWKKLNSARIDSEFRAKTLHFPF